MENFHGPAFLAAALFVVQLVGLVGRFTGKAHAELCIGAGVRRGEDDGGMGLALPKLGELVQRPPGQGIGGGADGQSDEGLIGVEPGIRASQMLDLHGLDGLDGLPGDEVVLMADPGQALEGVEERGGGGPHDLLSGRQLPGDQH